MHLRVVTNKTTLSLSEVTQKIHGRVKGSSFNKTEFALALMMADSSEWTAPGYIAEALKWLEEQLLPGVVAQRLSVARLGGFESAWNHPNGLLNLGWLPQPLQQLGAT